jgi:hypothetical protein
MLLDPGGTWGHAIGRYRRCGEGCPSRVSLVEVRSAPERGFRRPVVSTARFLGSLFVLGLAISGLTRRNPLRTAFRQVTTQYERLSPSGRIAIASRTI